MLIVDGTKEWMRADPVVCSVQQTPPATPVPPQATDPSCRNNDPRGNTPADPVVIDNLGDCLPVCEAELSALETYLEDVLREVIGDGAAGSRKKST